MRVINKTGWRTDHLRAFARAVADRTLDAKHRKTLLVEFRSSRSRGVAGYAYYNLVWDRRNGWHRYARITVPTGKKLAPNKRALVSVLEHEMLHTIGQKHPGDHGNHTMRGHYDDQTLAAERLAWAETLPLEIG